jgi:hypothetical protein
MVEEEVSAQHEGAADDLIFVGRKRTRKKPARKKQPLFEPEPRATPAAAAASVAERRQPGQEAARPPGRAAERRRAQVRVRVQRMGLIIIIRAG